VEKKEYAKDNTKKKEKMEKRRPYEWEETLEVQALNC
jgi:hypothetical protein